MIQKRVLRISAIDLFENPAKHITADVIDFPEEFAAQSRAEKFYVDPTGRKNKPNRTQITKLRQVDPELELDLPAIYNPSEDDVREVNGQAYYIIDIKPEKSYKRVPKDMQDKVDANGFWPGEVRAINVATGNIEAFPYLPAKEAIENRGAAIGEKMRQKVNVEIKRLNERITGAGSLDNATRDLTVLGMQIGSAIKVVDERLNTLNGMIAASQAKLKGFQEGDKGKGIKDWQDWIKGQIHGQGESLTEQKFIEMLFFHYGSTNSYDKMVADIQNGTVKIPPSVKDPEAFKQKLLNLANIALETSKEEEPTWTGEPFDITQFDISKPLTELPPGSVPVSHKPTSYHSFGAILGQIKNAIQGSIKDRDELQLMKSSLEGVWGWIGALGQGERGINFLQTPQGKSKAEDLVRLCNDKLKVFTQRYKRGILTEDNMPDPKKFGASGTLGNVSVIIALTRLYIVIAHLMAKLGITVSPPPLLQEVIPAVKTEKIEPEVPSPQPIASAQGRIVLAKDGKSVRISKAAWQSIGKKYGWL